MESELAKNIIQDQRHVQGKVSLGLHIILDTTKRQKLYQFRRAFNQNIESKRKTNCILSIPDIKFVKRSYNKLL
jgi:hypothetical protein